MSVKAKKGVLLPATFFFHAIANCLRCVWILGEAALEIPTVSDSSERSGTGHSKVYVCFSNWSECRHNCVTQKIFVDLENLLCEALKNILFKNLLS